MEKQTILTQNNNSIYSLKDSVIEELFSIIEIVTYKKLENVVNYHSANTSEYIVIEGICCSYILNYKESEATLDFYTTGNVLPPNQIRIPNRNRFIKFRH